MQEQMKQLCEPEGSDQLRELTLHAKRVKIILEYVRDYHPTVFEQATRRANINKEILRK